MTIETILAQREAIMKEADVALTATRLDAALLARPIDVQERHVTDIDSRIAALESARKDYNRRIDGEIAALKADQGALVKKIDTDRKILQPLVPAKTAAPRATKAKRSSASGKRPG